MTGDATREAIMEATLSALTTHGYADLTLQSIADEFEKSKSLILYHYDSKEGLLAAFVGWLLEDFLDRVRGEQDTDPATRLRRMARLVVRGTGDEATRPIRVALVEMRAQAPYNAALRSQLAENDRRIREQIAADVREGIERGQFRRVDPETYAALFRAAIQGAQTQQVSLGDGAPTEAVLDGVETLLIDDLLLVDGRDDGDAGDGSDGDSGVRTERS